VRLTRPQTFERREQPIAAAQPGLLGGTESLSISLAVVLPLGLAVVLATVLFVATVLSEGGRADDGDGQTTGEDDSIRLHPEAPAAASWTLSSVPRAWMRCPAYLAIGQEQLSLCRVELG